MKRITISSLLFIVLQNIHAQNAGTGTTAPVSRLHVSDSTVLFAGLKNITNSPGYEYQYSISNGILALFNKSANSGAIFSKPFTALITYKE